MASVAGRLDVAPQLSQVGVGVDIKVRHDADLRQRLDAFDQVARFTVDRFQRQTGSLAESAQLDMEVPKFGHLVRAQVQITSVLSG